MLDNTGLNDNPYRFTVDRKNAISKIASQIENILEERVGQVAQKTLFSNQVTVSPETLDILYLIRNEVQKRCAGEGLYQELDEIDKLCQKIISPQLKSLSENEIDVRSTIISINTNQLKMNEVLKGLTAEEAVDWISQNPAADQLEYADFSGFKDFDNKCLKQLTAACPNLKHLSLSSSDIEGDALKYLERIPGLLTLSLDCDELGEDALKNLAYVTGLQSLSIDGCNQLEEDA
jgi:hypothetical protein